jgi:hypothetical protein
VINECKKNRTWETLPKLPGPRGSPGCTRVTMNKMDYLVVMGGGDDRNVFTDVIFFNLASRVWETYPTKIKLPEPMTQLQAVVALQLDNQGCNMMILFNYPQNKLYVCQGNYNWNWFDTTGINHQNQKFITVGANELLPCGIEP